MKYNTWNKYVAKMEQYKMLPIDQWNYQQLLGYLLANINEIFEPLTLDNQIKYTGIYKGTINDTPSSHPMIISMRSIHRQLEENPVRTKDFLDYCLMKYRKNFNIKGLTFALNQYLSMDHKKSVDKHIKIDRSTELPQEMKINDNINTYGDLAFVLHISNFDMTPYIKLGLDTKILEQII